MKKLLFVMGTRPEAIKMAPIIREAARRPEEFSYAVCVTAQHREMLDQALSLFGIAPDYDLNLMRPNQTPSDFVARAITHLAPVIERERCDWLLVQGDTSTVMVSALAAFYARTGVAHVEAGLRTGDKYHPFPEEIHRRIASIVADLHFAPTQRARENLIRENVPSESVFVTGNPVIDALDWVAEMSYPMADDLLDAVPMDKKLVLVTVHRRENHGSPLEQICTALRILAEERQSDAHIVFPVHPNPQVTRSVNKHLRGRPHITLLPPLDYLPLVHLMKRAHLILTDSGGLQEEAPSCHTPVLVLRDVTERPEAVESGAAKLVGTSTERILQECRRLLVDADAHRRMTLSANPFGDGKAAGRMLDILSEFDRDR